MRTQWHPTKNGDLKPTDVTTGSGKNVWWLCDQGHEWNSEAMEGVRRKGCKKCR